MEWSATIEEQWLPLLNKNNSANFKSSNSTGKDKDITSSNYRGVFGNALSRNHLRNVLTTTTVLCHEKRLTEVETN